MPNLAAVLRRRLRMLKEDALAVAHTVESAFQGHDEVDDETLDKDLRQLFYDLQDEKILDIRRQEYERDGRRLRGYAWYIRDTPLGEIPTKGVADEFQELYRRLPQQAWEHRKSP